MNLNIDILAFSPHPDDAELGAAGFLLEMKKKGYTTGIIDLTKGEMSSTASAETRISESKKAAQILDLEVRENLNMGDSKLTDMHKPRLEVAHVIREYKPRVVLAPYWNDRHPDHGACSLMVKYAVLYARLKKLGEPHIVDHLYYYMLNSLFNPTFIIDISQSFQKKIDVLTCYSSQFETDAPYLAEYVPHATAKALYYGSLIHCKYGEPFLAEGFLRVSDPLTL